MEATCLTVLTVALPGLGLGIPQKVDGMQVIMLALGVAGLTIVILSTRRRIRKSQEGPRTSARQVAAEFVARQKATGDLEEVMLQLDELSRDIHGRIDAKLARLEVLIRQADQRIARLSAATGSIEPKPNLEITLAQEEPFEPAKDGDTAVDGEAEQHAPIYRLADQGLSPAQIANELGRLNGEVELILALRKAKEESDRRRSSPAKSRLAGGT